MEKSNLKLLTWLSPSFPVGSYTFSHGLEFAVENKHVTDFCTLQQWIEGILLYGSARNDSIIVSTTWKAIADGNERAFLEIAENAFALQPTSEIAHESFAQGKAFLQAISAGWYLVQIEHFLELLKKNGIAVSYPLGVAIASACHQIELKETLIAYLNSYASNLVLTGIKIIPLGQQIGLKVISNLSNSIIKIADFAFMATPSDLGSSTYVVDWTSAMHETQHTRLFQS